MNNKNGDALPDKKMDSEKKGKIIRYLLLVFYLLFYNVSIYFIIKLLTSNFLNNLSFSNIYDSTISLKITLFFGNLEKSPSLFRNIFDCLCCC